MFEGILNSAMELCSNIAHQQFGDIFGSVVVTVVGVIVGWKVLKWTAVKVACAAGRGSIALTKKVVANGRLFYATSLGSIVLASFGIGASQDGATVALTPDMSYPAVAAGIAGTLLSIVASINYAERKKKSSSLAQRPATTGNTSKA